MRKDIDNIYRPIPFWSWNDELDEKELVDQLVWMEKNGIGGFFMHARGGLKTPYLGTKWFDCIKACSLKAKELGMEAYAYDENGWPSGFCGGLLLNDEKNLDHYLTYEKGDFDPKAFVSYSLEGESLEKASSGHNCLNVYLHASPSNVDICNEEVVRKFLDSTHEEYKKRDTYDLKGFFTDEPQYYRWGNAYSLCLAEHFKKRYNESILDKLGLLFVEKEGYREFRYRYWKGMNELMRESFARQVYTWCDENGYKLTGHFVEENSLDMQVKCCGGIMSMYEFEHIPGLDFLGRGVNRSNVLVAHQLGSVANQLGKKQVLGEIYGCCGWDITPLECKKIAEYLFVDGMNLICAHLLPYHEDGQRKRDYPAHYSIVNPWVAKGFRIFNDYFGALGEKLANSKMDCHVAMLHPIRSCYFNYKDQPDGEGCGVEDLDNALKDAVIELDARHIVWDFLDETLLREHGSTKNGTITLGESKYDVLIIPKIFTMDANTEQVISRYVHEGGKILLLDEKPTYLEGREFDYSYLKSNITLEEIEKDLPYVASRSIDIRLARRIDQEGKPFYYIVNKGDVSHKFTLKDKRFPAFKKIDLLNDKEDIVDIDLILDEGESLILYPTEEKPLPKTKKEIISLPKEYEIVGKATNYLTLDKPSYSLDGVHYTKNLYVMAIQDLLLRQRYQGDLYLNYSFNIETIPSSLEALIEKNNVQEVRINGKVVECSGVSALENKINIYEVGPYLKKGQNEIIVKSHYFQSENVYLALYGENVTESLRNCLAYDSNVESIYLRGEFGVAGDFRASKKNPRVILGDNFLITAPKKRINSLILDGYPFLKGDISLKGKIIVNEKKAELYVPERFQMLEVKINGQEVGKMLLHQRLDISDYVKQGENDLEITLTVSNRNLLGESHSLEEEDINVYPRIWERQGFWNEKGEAKDYQEVYSFVKTIV